jgi:hypothetical protein
MPQLNAENGAWPPSAAAATNVACSGPFEQPDFRRGRVRAKIQKMSRTPRVVRSAAASLPFAFGSVLAGSVLASSVLAGSVLTSCGGDSQPDPPDTAGSGGVSGGGACPSDLPDRDQCEASTPSYGVEAAPIIEQRCATCHYPDNTQSRYVFADYDDVYRDRQTLLTRIYGCVMPPDGAPQLTPDERRVLLTWFVCGAPDN